MYCTLKKLVYAQPTLIRFCNMNCPNITIGTKYHNKIFTMNFSVSDILSTLTLF